MYTIANRQSYRLPQELTGMVMKNLASDLPSLSASSLVCKSWVTESSRFLFRDLVVTKPPGMDHDLLELVDKSERVRRNVRALRLAPAAGPPGVFKRPEDFQGFALDKLLQILVNLPLINELRVSSLRLDCDTEQPLVLQQFKSIHLVLTRLVLWNIPDDIATVRCYTLLLGSIRTISRLLVTPALMHEPEQRSLPISTPQPPSSTFVGSVPSSPLRIEHLHVNDGSMHGRYLEWFYNSRDANIESHRLISFSDTLSPKILGQLFAYHHDRSSTSIPRAIEFVESLTHLRFLSLDIGFLECTWAIAESATGTYLHYDYTIDVDTISCGTFRDVQGEAA